MNVAVLMTAGSPWARQFVRKLAETGHRVTPLAVGEGSPSAVHEREFGEKEPGASIENGSVDPHPIALEHPLLSGPKVVQLARALPRIIQGRESEVLLTLYAGNFALAAWLSRVRPYAVYVVGSDILFMRGLKRLLTRISLNAAQAVFVNGEYLTRKTLELAPRAAIHPLLIGVDTDFFSPQEKAPRPVHIVCTRAFKPVYDNERLIEALRFLEGFDADFRVIFTAAGPLLGRVRALAERRLSSGMNARIEFLGGISDEALRDTVRQSHIYVSMSLSDGTSTSLLEAMACGVFPIVSDIPQNREWIDPSAENGILVPLRTPEALAQALRRAITDGEWRERVAAPNREQVLVRANSTCNMRKIATVLESIVRAH